MAVRGIRGATTVEKNDSAEIIQKTRELLEIIIKKNGFAVEDVASVVFTVTDDLNAEFPAVAAREMGWLYTPLMCGREIPVPGSVGKCIRVLLHVNTSSPQKNMVHVYLHDARKLRPDIDSDHEDRYYISEP